ncbi:MAG: hypothetical protein HYW70_00175 [Candidatus Nealsonbacteria bacterium]|nr:hypothetical protein [Candidatus Nealsonbacteria bacterium]
MAQRKYLEHLKAIEARINKNLFFICSAVTIAAILMVLIEFFSRGVFPPTRINLFYFGVLIIYSVHKELVRWLGRKEVERQGEYFVYSWIGLTTTLYIINFLTKDYFNYSPSGQTLDTLRESTIITLEVLAVFIFTRSLKIMKTMLKNRVR